MSRFAEDFAAGTGSLAVDHHGETISFDDGAGIVRQLRAMVERDTDFNAGGGAVVHRVTISAIGATASIETDGRGGIDPSEVVVGRSRVLVAMRPGGQPTWKTIRNPASFDAGMTVLEVS